MKKTLFLIIAMVITCSFGFAQNYVVVNTQTIFSKIPAYVDAQNKVEAYSKEQQTKIDNAYLTVEKKYDTYQLNKASMSASARRVAEDEIINNEKKISEFQEKVFGQDGTLMEMTTTLFKPIQDNVTAIINKYAQQNKFDLIIDISSTQSVLYYSPTSDKTEDIIKLINNK